MKVFFEKMIQSIHEETHSIDIEGCEISIQETCKVIEFLRKSLMDLRTFFLDKEPDNEPDEIIFFKVMKPQVLSLLIYFNKIHTIEIKRPNGSNDIQKYYYKKEQDSLTYFFEKNIDFYQYYRSNSTYLDEYYFVRGKACSNIYFDSSQFIQDPLFSTGYDYKVAKILANEMLKIYLNKKILFLDKQCHKHPDGKANTSINKWTATKSAAIELGYALYASGVFNNGNIEIRDVMMLIETVFNIELGDYYRTYITIKSRKKERLIFLKALVENLLKRMDEDDTI